MKTFLKLRTNIAGYRICGSGLKGDGTFLYGERRPDHFSVPETSVFKFPALGDEAEPKDIEQRLARSISLPPPSWRSLLFWRLLPACVSRFSHPRSNEFKTPRIPSGYLDVDKSIQELSPLDLSRALSNEGVPEGEDAMRAVAWSFLLKATIWASKQSAPPHRINTRFVEMADSFSDMLSCMEILLNHGADPGRTNCLGSTAEMLIDAHSIIKMEERRVANIFDRLHMSGANFLAKASAYHFSFRIPLFFHGRDRRINAGTTVLKKLHGASIPEPLLRPILKKITDSLTEEDIISLLIDETFVANVSIFLPHVSTFLVHQRTLPELIGIAEKTSSLTGLSKEFFMKTFFDLGGRRVLLNQKEDVEAWKTGLGIETISKHAASYPATITCEGFGEWLLQESRKSEIGLDLILPVLKSWSSAYVEDDRITDIRGILECMSADELELVKASLCSDDWNSSGTALILDSLLQKKNLQFFNKDCQPDGETPTRRRTSI